MSLTWLDRLASLASEMARAGRGTQPNEPGWWLASDDRWYPPERSADPELSPRTRRFGWTGDPRERMTLQDDSGCEYVVRSRGRWELADGSAVMVKWAMWSWAATLAVSDEDTGATRAMLRAHRAGMVRYPGREPRCVGTLTVGEDESSVWVRWWAKETVVEFRRDDVVVGWVQLNGLGRDEAPVLVLRETAASTDGLLPLAMLEVAPKFKASGGGGA